MLKRLRRKIVALIMVLVGLVLIGSMALGPVLLFVKLNDAAENVLIESADRGPLKLGGPRIGKQPTPSAKELDNISGNPYPVFCVSLSEDGTLVANSKATTMDDGVLADAIERVLASTADTGRIHDLSLMYARVETDEGVNVAFLDTTIIDDNVISSAVLALQRIAIGMVVLFGIAVVCARYVTRPVAEAWAQQQRFVADASHELKTPLTVILASADIMGQHPEKSVSEQGKWLSSIEDEAKRMKKLVEELLAAARADEEAAGSEAKTDTPMATVDFSELVARSCLHLEAVAFDKNIDFAWTAQDGLACKGREEELERLVKILLENAMKYAAPCAEQGAAQAQVTLSAERAGAKIKLWVRNSGEPIASDVLPHLFERFYRADPARGGGESFGLGLYIAHTVAEGHHGSLTATSSSTGGTVFTLMLPAVTAAPAKAA